MLALPADSQHRKLNTPVLEIAHLLLAMEHNLTVCQSEPAVYLLLAIHPHLSAPLLRIESNVNAETAKRKENDRESGNIVTEKRSRRLLPLLLPLLLQLRSKNSVLAL
jgi:hypothetical protein